jgi:hypothetical protein
VVKTFPNPARLWGRAPPFVCASIAELEKQNAVVHAMIASDADFWRGIHRFLAMIV